MRVWQVVCVLALAAAVCAQRDELREAFDTLRDEMKRYQRLDRLLPIECFPESPRVFTQPKWFEVAVHLDTLHVKIDEHTHQFYRPFFFIKIFSLEFATDLAGLLSRFLLTSAFVACVFLLFCLW